MRTRHIFMLYVHRLSYLLYKLRVNYTANVLLHNAVHTLYQCVFFFQNVIDFWGRCINVISFGPTIKVRLFLRRFPRKLQMSDIINFISLITKFKADNKCESYPYTGLDSPWGFQEVRAPRISRQSAHEGDKVVSPTRRPPFSPRKYSWYSFLLEAESTPGP